MSKRKARQQQVAAVTALASRKKRRIAAVIALLLCLGLAGGIFAQWRAARIVGMNALLVSPSPPPPPPSSPSKEYIYAGGRLLATEEPTTSAGQQRTNFALAANGGVATASSLYSDYPGNSGNYPASAAINGDTKGLNLGTSAAWADGTPNSYSDWLEVTFNGSKSIDEIDIFSVQDNYTNPVEPTDAMTFNSYGIVNFDVQYWNGSSWATVPGGSVTGNNKVWRKITFSSITTTKIRVLVSYALNTWSRIVEIEAYGAVAPPPPQRINFAASANGATATASSVYGTGYGSENAINGERKGLTWGTNGGWSDGTPYTFGDWLQVDFNGTKTIDEIDIFTLQDDYNNPLEPTETTTFNTYGLVNFEVQYWDGSGWVMIPGGSITGNNKVWRKITFSDITTSKIRVVGNYSNTYYSRVTEIEAYGNIPPPTPINVALASQGATATASSLYSSIYGAGYYPASAAINGDRKGVNAGYDGLWVDGTSNSFPDWLQVDFSGSKIISEIDLFALQDDYLSPVEPTQTMTSSSYGLIDFELQYWNGSSWVAIPGGTMTGNNKIWRKFTFSPITTTKIRVWITNAPNNWSRVVEVEAWGN